MTLVNIQIPRFYAMVYQAFSNFKIYANADMIPIAILPNRKRMIFKTDGLKWLSSAICFAIFNIIQISDANSNELGFFKGNWDCKLQSAPFTTFRWLVKEENSWLSGSVQSGQNIVSSDFWRINNGKIERFAFARDGLLVKVESNGWESNKLVFLGSFNKQNEVSQVRETITRTTDKEFRAIWEKMGNNRRWVTITDERCTR